MERGAATRDFYAKAVVGAEAIEIKATIPDHQIRSALARFRLTRNNDQERLIYFFDTPKLDLLASGIITRARRVIGDEHDCTVKLRPVDPAKVGKQWRKYRDFKIEADASEKGLVKSASFSMPVAGGVIKRVAAGKKAIADIFTDEQEAFLATMAKRKIDFSTLAVLGPLTAQRWRFVDPACPWPITAELWKRGDGDLLLELSIKTPVVQAAVAVGGFMALLAEMGAERDNEQQAKTHWALDFYAAKLARDSSRRGAAGKKATGKKAAGKKAAGAKAAGAKAAGKAAAKAAGKKAGSKNPRLAARKPAGKVTAKAPRKAVRNRAAAKAPRKVPKRKSRRG